MGKIKTNVTALKKAIEMTEIVLTDNMMSDAVRNLIFYIKDNKIHIIGRSSVTCCLVEVEGETDRADDSFESVNLKELQGILKAYNNMKRTIPTTIEFEFKENYIEVSVSEVPANDKCKCSEYYNRTTKSRISLPPRVSEAVMKEVREVWGMDMDGEVDGKIDGVKMKDIVGSLLSTLKDGRDSIHTRIYFKDGKAYSFPAGFLMLMPNTLPIKEVVIPVPSAKFIVKYATDRKEEITVKTITSAEKPEEAYSVKMCFRKGNSKAVTRVHPTNQAYRLTDGDTINPAELKKRDCVVVDKPYFMDCLLRLPDETVQIVVGENQDMVLKGKRNSIQIPVLDRRITGAETYSYEITVALLKSMINEQFGENLYIYLMKNGLVSFTDELMVEESGTGVREHVWVSSARLKPSPNVR